MLAAEVPLAGAHAVLGAVAEPTAPLVVPLVALVTRMALVERTALAVFTTFAMPSATRDLVTPFSVEWGVGSVVDAEAPSDGVET